MQKFSVLENCYPIMGHIVPVNKWVFFKAFRDHGFYIPINDNTKGVV